MHPSAVRSFPSAGHDIKTCDGGTDADWLSVELIQVRSTASRATLASIPVSPLLAAPFA
jgi:hypothetical protein